MGTTTIAIGSNFHGTSREISIAFHDGVGDLPLSPFCGAACDCDKITWAKRGEETLSIDVHSARVFEAA